MNKKRNNKKKNKRLNKKKNKNKSNLQAKTVTSYSSYLLVMNKISFNQQHKVSPLTCHAHNNSMELLIQAALQPCNSSN